ncbi:MAG TPA: ATP synthase F1 subunit epsilon [Gemmatimonadales bacterium]|jgi:F-type H+-transporting ATPase subunit epsilon|nr:ATP synthase F1 subunit epsilon [Gemmatimonadales bacterium]
MHVTVISPDAKMFDGQADAVVAPAFDGEVGILPHHAPLMTLLGDGMLVVREGTAERRFRVRGGFLQVVGEQVRVVAEHAQGEPSHA